MTTFDPRTKQKLCTKTNKLRLENSSTGNGADKRRSNPRKRPFGVGFRQVFDVFVEPRPDSNWQKGEIVTYATQDYLQFELQVQV